MSILSFTKKGLCYGDSRIHLAFKHLCHLLFLLLLIKAIISQPLGQRGSKRELSDLGRGVNTLFQSPLYDPGPWNGNQCPQRIIKQTKKINYLLTGVLADK